MNTILSNSLDTIESSLAALLASIISNDPSAEAARALIAADDDLTVSLEQLVTHQTNHQRLLHLRSLSSALDSELSSLLTTLSSTRAELLSKPTTIFPSNVRQVEYDNLLSYATKISKYTRPPTHLAGIIGTSSGSSGAVTENNISNNNHVGGAAEDTSRTLVIKEESNGNLPSSNGRTGNNQGAAAPAEGGTSTYNAATQPTADDIAMLDPSANFPFAPWPSEEVMKRGLLARLEYVGDFLELEQQLRQQQSQGAGEVAEAQENMQNQSAVNSDGQTFNSYTSLEVASMSDADILKAREAAARREADRQAKEAEVFQGLDLYDPDME